VACVTQQPAEVTLAILVSVLTLVRLVVADDTPSCSTRGAVTGHVTSNATDYRTFNASLSIAELTVPTATPSTSNATSIFISNLP
jgi:hypothetical protein